MGLVRLGITFNAVVINPFQGWNDSGNRSAGWHPTLSNVSLSAINNFPAFDRLQIVTVQQILDGARMNLPLMEEVTKRAQKVKENKQIGLQFE